MELQIYHSLLFLHLIKKYLKEQKIDNFNFIDMGWGGSGRLVNYLEKNFKRILLVLI